MIKELTILMSIILFAMITWFVVASSAHVQQTRIRASSLKRLGHPQSIWQVAPTGYFIEQTASNKDTVIEEKFPFELATSKASLCGSNIKVALDSQPTKQQGVSISLFQTSFQGAFCVRNPKKVAQRLIWKFPLPVYRTVYRNLRVLHREEGSKKETEIPFRIVKNNHILAHFLLDNQKEHWFRFTYEIKGRNQWKYGFTENKQIKNFSLQIRTNSSAFELLSPHLLPTKKKLDGNQSELTWKFHNLISSVQLGVVFHKEMAPLELASRTSKKSPYGLFFCFLVLWLVLFVKKKGIHPLFYFLTACGFLTQQFLFLELIPFLQTNHAILVSCLVSIFLVNSYLMIPLGKKMTSGVVFLPQVAFFSLLHVLAFSEESNGLITTILSILLLFIVMQVSARFKFHEKLQITEEFSSSEEREQGAKK